MNTVAAETLAAALGTVTDAFGSVACQCARDEHDQNKKERKKVMIRSCLVLCQRSARASESFGHVHCTFPDVKVQR